MEDAPRDGAADLEAALGENLEHAIVFTEHLRLELGDPTRARDAREVIEEQTSDSTPLMTVEDGERHLGAFGRVLVGAGEVSPHTDDPLAAALLECRDQAHRVHEVQIGEVAAARPPSGVS